MKREFLIPHSHSRGLFHRDTKHCALSMLSIFIFHLCDLLFYFSEQNAGEYLVCFALGASSRISAYLNKGLNAEFDPTRDVDVSKYRTLERFFYSYHAPFIYRFRQWILAAFAVMLVSSFVLALPSESVTRRALGCGFLCRPTSQCYIFLSSFPSNVLEFGFVAHTSQSMLSIVFFCSLCALACIGCVAVLLQYIVGHIFTAKLVRMVETVPSFLSKSGKQK